MSSEVCTQHADCNQVTRSHGERIAVLENKIESIEGVQKGMVKRLEEAAQGLRALAGKIDNAVNAANGQPVHEEPLSTSLNAAWRHFQKNFAMFVIYGGAGLFAWAAFKTVVFNEVPPMVKHLVSFFR